MSDAGMEAVAPSQNPPRREIEQTPPPPMPPKEAESGQSEEATRVTVAIEEHAGQQPVTSPDEIEKPQEALADVAGIPHPTVNEPTESSFGGVDEGGYRGFHGDELEKRLFDVLSRIQEGANFDGDKTQELLREALSRQFPQLATAEGDIFLNVMKYMRETKPPQNVYGDIQWKLFEEQYRNLSTSLTDEQRYRVLSDFYTLYDPSQNTVSRYSIDGGHIMGNVLDPNIAHEREEIKTAYIAYKLRQQYNKGVIDSQAAASPEVRTVIGIMAEEWKKGHGRLPVTNEQTLLVRNETNQEFQARALNEATYDLAEILKMGIDDVGQIDALIPDNLTVDMLEQRVLSIRNDLDAGKLDPKAHSEQLTKNFVGDEWVSEAALRGLDKAFATLAQTNPNNQQAQQAVKDIQSQLGFRGWKRFTNEARGILSTLFGRSK